MVRPAIRGVRPVRLIAAVIALAFLLVPRAGSAAAFASETVLQIYPLAALGNVDPAAGVELSSRLAREIGELGRVRVLNGRPDTAPADYRAVARAAGADVYLTGSIAVVGTGVAVIVQVVSTRSGTVLWSSTKQLANVGDIHGEGARVHEMLIQREARPYLDLSAATAATSAPVSKAGKSSSALAKGNAPDPARTATPVVKALPIPAADAPDEEATPSGPNTVVMLGFASTAKSRTPLRTLAERAIVDTFARRGVRAGSDTEDAPGPIAVWADRICTETSARLLLTGSVALDVPPNADSLLNSLSTARVALRPYDCTRRVFDAEIVRSNASLVWTAAVQKAVAAAVTAVSVPASIHGGS